MLSHLTLSPDLSLVTSSSRTLSSTTEWGVIPWPDVDQPDRVSFDHQPELRDHPGPSPSLILQVWRARQVAREGRGAPL